MPNRKQIRRRRATAVGLVVLSIVLLTAYFSETASGAHWIGLRANNAYRVTSVEQAPLLPPWLALILLLGTLLLAWRLEGR